MIIHSEPSVKMKKEMRNGTSAICTHSCAETAGRVHDGWFSHSLFLFFLSTPDITEGMC